ncbi:insulin-like peptide receptor isoform X3 [Daphnia pulex]|uniref:insulin-like peptide receptor isoform X3 n=1 Tax=Daphnia pulex TaxID=6669 RepID=UPI001EDFB4E0|nr:insulin-like peptide receptor isoform X3 [Daphnia pulex]
MTSSRSSCRRLTVATALVCCLLAGLAVSLPAGELANSQTMSSSSSVSASFSSSSVQQSASASVSSSADKKQLIKTTTTTTSTTTSTTSTTTDAAPIVIPLDETEKEEAQPDYQEPQSQPEPEPEPKPEPEPEPKPEPEPEPEPKPEPEPEPKPEPKPVEPVDTDATDLQNLQKPKEEIPVLKPVDEETKADVEEESNGNSIQQQHSARPAAENREEEEEEEKCQCKLRELTDKMVVDDRITNDPDRLIGGSFRQVDRRTCPALRSRRRGGFFLAILVVFVIFLDVTGATSLGQALPALPISSIDAYQPLREKEICPSIEVRNGPQQFSELEGCRVVEGFLHIVLMENLDFASDLNNRSFPALREITGYLLFYRVFGLRSIGQLFPNLAVIRGQQLLFDFSFVVYELMQLQEIGLKSLAELQRGSVLIEKNPNLCYVESIDWGRIGHSGRLNHFIQGNKRASECPKCQDRCPAGGDGRRLCWNNDDCQKVCDQCGQGVSGACSVMTRDVGRPSDMRCCHEECAGGCSGGQSNQCDVCKHVIHNDECRSVCPPGHYLFMKRRCVTDVECITMLPPRQSVQEYPYVKKNWKVFAESGECILECPPGFQEKKINHNDTLHYFTCVPCQGPCPKVCKGLFVSNIETVQKLRGCTTIDGDLEMQIKGGDNIIQELERSLGSIEVIKGVLKITRSFPILSLSFFKSLRNITGKPETEHSIGSKNFDDEYALTVQDNQNLQQLWPKTQNLTIFKKMLFHFNPKLCLNLIEELVNSSTVPGTLAFKHSDVDISPWSNGDKATCDEQVLNVTIVNKSDKSMQLSWNNFRATLADKRQLLGYVISYIEAPYKNVSYFDRRDACGGDGWTTIDVAANHDAEPEENEMNIITYLKPYTQYAIYVQTYTVAPQQTGKRIGARSPILYERTSPAEPDQPEDLRASANSSSELVIDWKPPINPNGIVTHYIVTGSWRKDDQDYFDKLDTCAEHASSLVVSETKKPVLEETSPDNRTSIFGDPSIFAASPEGNNNPESGGGSAQQGKCCQCTGTNDKVTLEKKEKEQQFKIEFENFLHDKIYIKDTIVLGRKKRHVDTTTEIGDPDNNAIEFPEDKPTINSSHNQAIGIAPGENHTNFYDGNNRLITFYQKVTGTSYTVVGVRHYAEYTIKVIACHDHDPFTNRTLCSMTAALTSARTKQSDFADDIVGGVVRYESNNTSRSIKIGWNEPEDPNGLIKKYLLEYRRSDNGKVVRECVRRKDFVESQRTKLMVDLIPGNYCVQVRAVSLAGPGPPTKDVCFLIEEHFNGMTGSMISGIFVVVLLVVILLAVVLGYYFIKNKKYKDDHGTVSINPDYHKYVPDEWEVARDNVVILRELGQGSFGMVYEGLLRNTVPNQPEVKCAIKTVNEKANVKERMEFLTEASVMKEFNANHVLKLLGVVSKAQPTLVIMELMANGDLKSYLRSHRPDCEENVTEGRQPPTLKCILKMAIEIADGMMYLSEKKYVHRDLAARNCMVAGDMTVKIGDFGLTRDIYETDYYRKGGKGLLPVRWMAPESLRDGVYTSQCDVWSFGVVLWEMATLASQPYQGLTNEQVLKYVIDGGVMERPEGCPDRLYNLMESCWQYVAKRRPTFIDLIENLLPDVPVQFASVSFFHSDAGVSARAAPKAHYEQETQLLNETLMSLPEGDSEFDEYLMGDPLSRFRHYASDQIVQIDDERHTGEEIPLTSNLLLESRRSDEGGEEGIREEEVGDDDHVPVLFPHDRGGAYILVKNPGGQIAANGNGSKSESSKGTTSMASEDSKGSYVSNGSASNGYVLGILKQRRYNNT